MSIYATEKGQIWVKRPHRRQSTSKGVWVYPGEDVQWHYTHTPHGKEVTGYPIVPSQMENTDREVSL